MGGFRSKPDDQSATVEPNLVKKSKSKESSNECNASEEDNNI